VTVHVPEPQTWSPAVRRGAAFLGLLLGVALVYWALRSVSAALGIALLLAYLLSPVVDAAERRGVPRAWSALAMVVLSLALLGVLILLVLPFLQSQIAALAERLPGLIQRFFTEAVPWVEQRFGIQLPRTTEDAVSDLRSTVGSLEAARPFTAAIGQMFRSTASFVLSLLQLTLVPFLAFYALRDARPLRETLIRLIPDEIEESVLQAARDVNSVVAAYLRGQLSVIAILSLLYAVGYALAGVPFAALVGLTSGLLSIIPFVGTAIGLLLAATLCLSEYGVDVHLVYTGAAFAVAQAIEANVLTPRIVGGRLGLHPLAVILGLIAMGQLLGFLGMVLALPLLASLKVLFWPWLIGQARETAAETAPVHVDAREPD
jgi:predicted PurR-regulated permease PerM